MSQSLRARLDSHPMSPYQWAVIGLCLLLNAVDGLDVMAMAFTATEVAQDWGLSGTELGLLLSAGIVGMALGSIFVAPLADRFGRRPLLLASLLVSGLGMVFSYQAPGPISLGLLRLMTGVGVGVVLVGANVLTSENANQRWRGLAIGLQSVGFALGATLGGLLATQLNDTVGWRYVFLYGGVITLIAGALCTWALPESLDFLLYKRPHRALARVNRLLSRMRQAPLGSLPEVSAPSVTNKGYRALFTGGQWRTTLLLALAFFLVMFSFYFVMSWTPKLLAQSGLSARHGIAGGMLLTIGGMVGALLMGLGASRYDGYRLLQGFLLITVALMVLMVPATAVFGLALTVGFGIGMLLNGAVASLYTIAPQRYSADTRTRGVGFVLGVGRFGAMASPVVAGLLLDAQWTPQSLYWLYGASLMLAVLVVSGLNGVSQPYPPRSAYA
ncbi:MFS transporter [Vreelandella sp. EE22]